MGSSETLILRPLEVDKAIQSGPLDGLLSLLKRHLRITSNDDDVILQAYIKAAMEAIELATNRSIVEQQITARYDLNLDYTLTGSGTSYILNSVGSDTPRFSRMSLHFLYQPAISLVSLDYFDEGSNRTTFPDTEYILDATASLYNVTIRQGFEWPNLSQELPYQVEAVYTAGYKTLPSSLELAIIQLASGYFMQRLPYAEKQQFEIPMGTANLLEKWRIDNYDWNRQRPTYTYLYDVY